MKEMEESLLMIKTTENRTEMKQFKSFRFQEYENTRGKLCRRETKSSLGLNFW